MPEGTEKGHPAISQHRLKELLGELLKPVAVKRVVVTGSDRYGVRGILTTMCPIERRESAKDFEVDLDGRGSDSIRQVKVDGRRLFPPRAERRRQEANL